MFCFAIIVHSLARIRSGLNHLKLQKATEWVKVYRLIWAAVGVGYLESAQDELNPGEAATM